MNTNIDFSSLKAFVNSLLGVINSSILPLLITIGIVLFVWNLMIFVMRSDNETERAKSKTYMLWSIIALFLIFSVWGIIALLRNTVGINNPLPQFKEPGSATSQTTLPATITLPPLTGQMQSSFTSGTATPVTTTPTVPGVIDSTLPQADTTQIIFPGGKQ